MLLRTIIGLTVATAAVTQQCNNSGSSPGGASIQNFQTITVNAGPTGDYFNGAFTTVTICVPGQSSTCQTIDGILVDTGSIGVRVLASKLSLNLQQQTDATGAPVGECAQFVDGFTWGPVVAADVRLGGEQASSVPIQSIGVPGFAAVPASCANSGTEEDTLDTLGANGILGVGVFREDCGPACSVAGASNPGLYFSCPSGACRVAAQPLARQLQNPVAMFASDNNGVAIQLPSVPIGGAATASGMIAFGIGTQSNNAVGAARALTLDPDGNLTTVFGGQSYGGSYIDSGSNGIFFLDSRATGLPACSVSKDFYCPPTLQAFSAANRGVNGVSIPVNFSVGNIDTLNGRFTAFTEVAGPNPGAFDWGLPFFYGRTVFTAIEGQSTPAGTGPYFAY